MGERAVPVLVILALAASGLGACAGSSPVSRGGTVGARPTGAPVAQGAEPRRPVAGRERQDYPKVDRQGRPVATLLESGDAERGARIYADQCERCHGTDGKGTGPFAGFLSKSPRDFTRGDYMRRLPPERLYEVVRDGGDSVGLSRAMPAFGRKLTDQQIADVIAHITRFGR